MGRRDRSDSVDAFGVLASDTRLAILETVWASQIRQQGAIPYTRLKDEVEVADSGKFNYHLDKLRGRFVREEANGYVPEMQGIKALEPVLDGWFRDVEEDYKPVEGHCPVCGGGLQAGYHWNFHVGCGECWASHLYYTVEPNALDQRDWRELLLAVERARQYKIAALLDGACPDCGGRTDFHWYRYRNPDESAPTRMKTVGCSVYCTACMTGYSVTPGEFLRAHPRVREYCEEHGIDLDARPFWTYEWVLTDLTTVVHGEDPWRVEKVATVDGCRLAVVFDPDGCVETVTHADLRGGRRADPAVDDGVAEPGGGRESAPGP